MRDAFARTGGVATEEPWSYVGDPRTTWRAARADTR